MSQSLDQAVNIKLKLARAWDLQGNSDRAIAGYRAAIELSTQFPEAYHLLGSLLVRADRLEEAIQLYIQALAIHPTIAKFHKQLTNLLIQTQGLAAAFSHYGLAPVTDPAIQLSEAAILCLIVVRNESLRLPYLLSYYRQQGIDRFLIIDHHSTDNTKAYLLTQPDVSLWTGDRPFDQVNFGSAWFELLLRKYGVGHWCLTINADEILYYLDCEVRTIRQLCADLDRKYQLAFPAMLLDMYSDRSIQETYYQPGQNFLEVCPYFDRQFYHQLTIETDLTYQGQIRYMGGMRARVFGEQGQYMLNKIPLLKYRPDLLLTGGQHFLGISDTQISRETGALLHCKYFASLPGDVTAEVKHQQHWHNAFQDQEYAAKLDTSASLILFDPTQSIQLVDSQQLVDLGVIKRDPVATPANSSNSGASRQPHILFYGDCFGLYGATQWSHTVMLFLLNCGYRVSSVQYEVQDYLTDAQKDAGITHYWLQRDTMFDRQTYPHCFYNHAEPDRLFSDIQPDLILFTSGWPVSNLTATEVAKERKIPYIFIIRSVVSLWAEIFADLLPRLATVYQHAESLITVSQENLNLLHQYFGLDLHLGRAIYSGRPELYFQSPNLEIRARLRQEWGIPDDGIICFTAARFDPCKGYQYQIMAMQQLQQEDIFSRLYFVWAGFGTVMDRVKSMVKELRMIDRVYFLGERSDIPELLDAADIFILPSQHEGMPLAVMEAMAKGLPVIATAVSGIPEELGDTGALLPDPSIDSQKTIVALAHTLKDWASHPEILPILGQKCRERAIELFTEGRMLRQYLSLIEQTLSENQE